MKYVAALLTIGMAAYAVRQVDSQEALVDCIWEECNVPCGGGTRVCQRTNGEVWNHTCHTHRCEPYDQCGVSDLVFVLDSTASIGEKSYWMLKQWTIDIVKGLNIDMFENRVACVIYDDLAMVEFNLTGHLDEASLEEGLWSLPWMAASNTNTYDGIVKAEQTLETRGRGGSVKKMVIIVTDGASNINGEKVPEQSRRMQEDLDITMVSIGVGNEIDDLEIWTMGSYPKKDHVHHVRDYDALHFTTSSITEGIIVQC